MIEVDIDRAINIAVKSGKVELGARNAILNAQLGKARLIILAENCPAKTTKRIEFFLKGSKTSMMTLTKSSLELGTICGRPHRISALTIHDPGDSKILEVIDTKSEAH
ncbi:MAG: 50S ribosomal protein L30e [Promethearchaeota archaeon]